MIGQDEYFLFKKNYAAKIKAAEDSIKNLESEKEGALDKNREDLGWMEVFSRYQNIDSLERKVIVELISEIQVFEKKRIGVHFRNGDDIERLSRMLEQLPDEIRGQLE